jgi:LPS-assembly lipoprotein
MAGIQRSDGRCRRFMPTMSRLIATGVLCMALTACGFHLRGMASLPFDSLYVAGSSQLASQIARTLRAGSQTRVTDNPNDAQVTLEIIGEQRERAILSLSSSGRVREITLIYRLSYRLYNRTSDQYMSPGEIVLRRDLSYTDTEVIAKEQEEVLLYRDMQNDAVQQLMRRLAATRVDS